MLKHEYIMQALISQAILILKYCTQCVNVVSSPVNKVRKDLYMTNVMGFICFQYPACKSLYSRLFQSTNITPLHSLGEEKFTCHGCKWSMSRVYKLKYVLVVSLAQHVITGPATLKTVWMVSVLYNVRYKIEKEDRDRKTHWAMVISSLIACTVTSWSLSKIMEIILSCGKPQHSVNLTTSSQPSLNTILHYPQSIFSENNLMWCDRTWCDLTWST